MESTKNIYIPVGQAIKTKNRTINVKKLISKHRLTFAISAISITLLSIYAFLMVNFIQLIKILN